MKEESPIRFLHDATSSIQHTRNRLPHWQEEGLVVFVTFRLADSIPLSLLKTWDGERATWLVWHPRPWSSATELEYHRRFSGKMERALDEGHGECLLRHPPHADVVGEALNYFDGSRCRQLAWVVMPNHVHALFTLLSEGTLENLVASWKSFTARKINALNGRSGTLWQKDYFDRLIRDKSHFHQCVRYIRNNPTKAKLKAGEYQLWESELVREIVFEEGD